MTFRTPRSTRTIWLGLTAIAGLLATSLALSGSASAKALRPSARDGISAAWTMRGTLVAKAKQPKGRPAKDSGGGTMDEKHACAAAYTKAQERAQAAHLREAKELLSKCARATCGTFLHQECTTLYTQLDADIPSVVPLVTDEAGAPHALVEVRMDGELLTSKLDGHALPVDPGKHEFSFSTDAGVFASQKVMIVQGQRNRTIAAKLRSGKKSEAVAAAGDGAAAGAPEGGAAEPAAKTEAPPAEAESNETESSAGEPAAAPRVRTITRTRTVSAGTPVLSYVFAGTGVAALGGAAALTFWGRKDNTALDKNCDPNCSQSSVNHVKKLYLAADVAAGVGVASLIVSTWLYVRAHTTTTEEIPAPSTATTKQRPKRAVQTALRFDVLPAPSGGALATVGGTF
jgi:hypothetical protein